MEPKFQKFRYLLLKKEQLLVLLVPLWNNKSKYYKERRNGWMLIVLSARVLLQTWCVLTEILECASWLSLLNSMFNLRNFPTLILCQLLQKYYKYWTLPQFLNHCYNCLFLSLILIKYYSITMIYRWNRYFYWPKKSMVIWNGWNKQSAHMS
jgi:hypothetical protein